MNINNLKEVEEFCKTATTEQLFNVMDYILRNKGASLAYYDVRGEIYRRLTEADKRVEEARHEGYEEGYDARSAEYEEDAGMEG